MTRDPAPSGAEPLAVIVVSGAYVRVHYALVLASSSAAIGRPAILFFTMDGCGALVAAGADGVAGWRRLDGAANDDAHVAAGIAGFETLLEACVELGVDILVCETGLRALGLRPADLRSDVPFRVVGAVTLLAAVANGGVVIMA
jgi:peroxiredoxin family protein